MATYVQKGTTIDITASANISAGDVVPLTSRIGVAAGSVKSGELCSVAVTGVFEIDKTESLAIALGDTVYYNTTTGKITKTNTDVPAGWAIAAAAAAASTVLVKIG